MRIFGWMARPPEPREVAVPRGIGEPVYVGQGEQLPAPPKGFVWDFGGVGRAGTPNAGKTVYFLILAEE